MSNTSGKRIAKNTLLLYFRMLLIMGVSLFTSRILLQSLGIVDYGLHNVVAGVISLFSFLNASLSAATSRFITYELGKQNLGKIRTAFCTSIFIHICLAIGVLVLGETIGVYMVNYVLTIPDNRLFACNVVFQMVIFSAMFTMIQVPLNSLIVSHERMNVYAYIGIADALFRCLIAYAILSTTHDKLIMLSGLQMFWVILLFSFYLYYCKSRFASILVSFKLQCECSYVRSMLSYTTWSLIGSTANMLKNQGVNVLINIFFGSAVNAANAIAYQVNNAVINFTSNFTMAMNPQIIKSYAAGEYQSMKSLMLRGGKFSFFMLMFLCFPILFETDFLLSFWLGNYPDYTVVMARLVLILTMVETFTYSIGCAVQATGNIKYYQLIISGINMMNFPISFLLYHWGCLPYTALIVSICISAITVLTRLYFIKTLLHISPREYLIKVLARCLVVALIALPLPYLLYIHMNAGWSRFIALSVVIVIVNSFTIYMLGLTTNERVFVKNVIKKTIQRFK